MLHPSYQGRSERLSGFVEVNEEEKKKLSGFPSIPTPFPTSS
jgi:hypothetical protein